VLTQAGWTFAGAFYLIYLRAVAGLAPGEVGRLTAALVFVEGPPPPALAFAHSGILPDAPARARSKVEYTPLATAFLEPEFTIPELRAVYEEIWGEPLHAGNFHRKVLSVPGFVVSTGRTTTRGGSKGGPRARLYRAGGARTLHPALLRPGDRDDVSGRPLD